jgi:hypothetical protein
MQEGYDNTPIVLAVVGHCDPLFLDQIKQTIESLPHFKIVFVKTSHGKLYIVGEQQ